MAGSASLEFIQQVLVDADDDAELDAWAVLDALDTLVDRSLVAVLPSGERRRAALSPARNAARLRARVSGGGGRAAGAAASPRAGGGGAVRCRLRGVLQRSRRRGRLAAPPRARPRQRARRLALGPRRGRRRAWSCASARTLLRALPPSLHARAHGTGRCLRGAHRAGVPEALQLQAWIELSCVLADSQKARGRHAAEAALALARRLDARQGDRFVLYHALCRAASAAAQAGDLAAGAGAARRAAGARRSVLAGAAPALGRRGRTVGRAHERRHRGCPASRPPPAGPGPGARQPCRRSPSAT